MCNQNYNTHPVEGKSADGASDAGEVELGALSGKVPLVFKTETVEKKKGNNFLLDQQIRIQCILPSPDWQKDFNSHQHNI